MHYDLKILDRKGKFALSLDRIDKSPLLRMFFPYQTPLEELSKNSSTNLVKLWTCINYERNVGYVRRKQHSARVSYPCF